MKPDLTLSQLCQNDLTRSKDLVDGIDARMSEENTPSVAELWDRRLVVRALRKEIRDILDSKVPIDLEGDWKDLERRVNGFLFENFTRQIEDDPTKIQIINDAGVKHEKYASTNSDERRTYLGLHRRKLDNDGLSVVVAFKPALHEQSYHVHSATEENTMAIHPTLGMSFDSSETQANFHFAKPGEIINFGNGVPHTLKNMSRKISADASVKVPAAINDRTRLDRNDIWAGIGKFEAHKESGFVIPEFKKRLSHGHHTRYLIEDCGSKYKVDFLQLFANGSVDFEIDEIAADTLGLMTVFPAQGSPNAKINIEGHGQPVVVNFSDWAVLSPNHKGPLQLKNRLDDQAFVYMVREV